MNHLRDTLTRAAFDPRDPEELAVSRGGRGVDPAWDEVSGQAGGQSSPTWTWKFPPGTGTRSPVESRGNQTPKPSSIGTHP